MTASKSTLIARFLEDYSQHLGSAGCNDMDQNKFAGLNTANLKKGFDAWDQTVNPAGWEQRPIEDIQDREWVDYLKAVAYGDAL